jgi:predicted nucleotide-binding protein (sugar kinase/HSP70/actin superfamily)
MSGKSLPVLGQPKASSGGGCSSGGCSSGGPSAHTHGSSYSTSSSSSYSMPSASYSVNPALTEGLSEAERRELEAFAQAEAKNLGITEAVQQWFEPPTPKFTKEQRNKTTIWVSGLTWSQDIFLAAALRGIGYDVKTMPVPDNGALQLGKEFGNRGQCNPTYYTVGNLVKHLKDLESSGLTKARVIQENLYITAGACGPCRFGTYVTEYRKALRDSGFEGFRVLLMEQSGTVKQATGEENGIVFDAAFNKALLMSFLAGDVLNIMGYRIRPYEIDAGSTDAAIDECRKILVDAFENRKSVLKALYRCRQELQAVPVDKLRAKPTVSIIGEFWAMTTEGDGNYQLQRFVEQEGGEVMIQPITNWLLYLLWDARRDMERRLTLRGEDKGRKGLKDKGAAWKQILVCRVGRHALMGVFKTFAALIGLEGWHLPDMDHIAKLADGLYDNELRGGEGHMEVGKVIDNVETKHAHMVISVKPFGCMPSSGVSDGVQSYVTGKHPELIFCPIETTGDGKVNVHSRVQMMLFKAHERARAEFDKALADTGLTLEEARKLAKKYPKAASATHHPHHTVTGTGANTVYELAKFKKSLVGRIKTNRILALVS